MWKTKWLLRHGSIVINYLDIAQPNASPFVFFFYFLSMSVQTLTIHCIFSSLFSFLLMSHFVRPKCSYINLVLLNFLFSHIGFVSQKMRPRAWKCKARGVDKNESSEFRAALRMVLVLNWDGARAGEREESQLPASCRIRVMLMCIGGRQLENKVYLCQNCWWIVRPFIKSLEPFLFPFLLDKQYGIRPYFRGVGS